MGSSAGENKSAEHPEDSVKRNVTILADEINEDDRNAIVREGNQTVRNDVQPEHQRIPYIAISVGHEIGRKKTY